MICDDPDAPTVQPWVHWLIYRIPASVCELPEGLSTGMRLDTPIQASQGRNSWSETGNIGYRGPAPPSGHGVHHYHFKLYALSEEIKLQPGADKAALVYAIQDCTLEMAELVGTYQR
jgi:Raf kinase inhibitor-like YbhB/YbcL family protein